MHRKRKVRSMILLFGVALISLLYYTRQETKAQGINQSEVIWNSAEELQLLSGVENKIKRAQQGNADIIPVSSSASGYEAVCPEMQVNAKQSGESGEINHNEKTVFLTFDDGPSRQTDKVLDILEAYQIKATFFVVSRDMTESGSEALRRAANSGHVIGMHSDTHEYKKIYDSVENLIKDYAKVYQMIKETTGKAPQIYRFPGGSYNSIGRSCIKSAIPELERRGFTYFDWNVTAEDAVGNPTASSIKKNIFHNLDQIVQPVILMHDGPCNSLTVEVLPEIIEELVQRGYSFDTLDHREPCYFNW